MLIRCFILKYVVPMNLFSTQIFWFLGLKKERTLFGFLIISWKKHKMQKYLRILPYVNCNWKRNLQKQKSILLSELRVISQKENHIGDKNCEMRDLWFKVDENLRKSRNEFWDFVEIYSVNINEPMVVVLLKTTNFQEKEKVKDIWLALLAILMW